MTTEEKRLKSCYYFNFSYVTHRWTDGWMDQLVYVSIDGSPSLPTYIHIQFPVHMKLLHFT